MHFKRRASARLAQVGMLIAVGAAALLGCRSSSNRPVTSSPGGDQIPQRGDRALASIARFELTRRGSAERYPLLAVRLTFDDGSGERVIPGDVLAIPRYQWAYLPNAGAYPTASSGSMRVRLVLSAFPTAQDTLASTELELPLQPDWVWTVSAHIRAASDSSDFWTLKGSMKKAIVPIRDRSGADTGDVLQLTASGSRPSEKGMVP
jgi:hypothetical protein